MMTKTISRFNRYIVECKETGILEHKVIAIRFNRYIVECKGTPVTARSFRRVSDLIDTLWNVKFDAFHSLSAIFAI